MKKKILLLLIMLAMAISFNGTVNVKAGGCAGYNCSLGGANFSGSDGNSTKGKVNAGCQHGNENFKVGGVSYNTSFQGVRATVVDGSGNRVAGTKSVDLSWTHSSFNLVDGKSGDGLASTSSTVKWYTSGGTYYKNEVLNGAGLATHFNGTISLVYWQGMSGRSYEKLRAYVESTMLSPTSAETIWLLNLLGYNTTNFSNDSFFGHYVLFEPLMFFKNTDTSCMEQAYYGTVTEVFKMADQTAASNFQNAARYLRVTDKPTAGLSVVSGTPTRAKVISSNEGWAAAHFWLGKCCEGRPDCPEEEGKLPDCGPGMPNYDPLTNTCPPNTCSICPTSEFATDCNASSEGYVNDIGDIGGSLAEWACIFKQYDAPSDTYAGKFYNVDELASYEFSSNPYCTVACREEVNYSFSGPFTVLSGTKIAIEGAEDYKFDTDESVYVLDPGRMTGVSTCRTASKDGTTANANINWKQFEKDYEKVNAELKVAYDAWQNAEAQLQAFLDAQSDEKIYKTEELGHSQNDCKTWEKVKSTSICSCTEWENATMTTFNCTKTSGDGYDYTNAHVEYDCVKNMYDTYHETTECSSRLGGDWVQNNRWGCKRSYTDEDGNEQWEYEGISATCSDGYSKRNEETYGKEEKTCDNKTSLSNCQVWKDDHLGPTYIKKYHYASFEKNGYFGESRYYDTNEGTSWRHSNYWPERNRVWNEKHSTAREYRRLYNLREQYIKWIMQCNNFQRDYDDFDPDLTFTYGEQHYSDVTHLLSKDVKKNSQTAYYKDYSLQEQVSSPATQTAYGAKYLTSKWDCKGNYQQCVAKDFYYPVNDYVVQITEKEYTYTLEFDTYRYMSKNGRSYNTEGEAQYVEPYKDFGYPTLPISFDSDEGKYTYYYSFYYDSSAQVKLFGDSNKFTQLAKGGLSGTCSSSIPTGRGDFRNKVTINPSVDYKCEYYVDVLIKKCPDACCETNTCGVVEEGLDPNNHGFNIIYRPISLDNPFPGEHGVQKNGEDGRTPGSNWNGNVIDRNGSFVTKTYAFITKNRGVTTEEVYKKTPMYEFVLGANNIRAIRNYNKEQEYNYADYDTLECKNGEYCSSTFLSSNNNGIYFQDATGTCYGWSRKSNDNDWNACRY